MPERGLIVGSLSDCDVRVESPMISGRHCRLTQRGDTYLLEDLGSTNGTYVANQRITVPQIVRRGDAVTLGQKTPFPWNRLPVYATIGRAPGNDLVVPFETVSAHHARVEQYGAEVFLVDLDSTNGTALNDPLNKITRSPLAPRDVVFLGSHRLMAADLLAALPQAQPLLSTFVEQPRPQELVAAVESEESPASDDGREQWSARSWVIGVGISCVIVAVVISGRMLRQGSDPAHESALVAAEEVPKETTPTLSGIDSGIELESPVDPSTSPLPTAPLPNEPAPSPAVAEDPWQTHAETMRHAVFLLAIEEPNNERTWPAATATAIADNTLLTTARMVTGLAAAQQQGWTVWAINESSNLKLEISSLRVHVGFVKSANNPEEQIFFDLGLVGVSTKLPRVVELAESVDMTALEPGLPVACAGITYENLPLFRFQSSAAELTPAKVLEVARLGPPPAPSLLIFGADLTTKPCGAPVINRQGKLCAVFAESAAGDESAVKMHYAPLADRDLLQQSDNSDVWVEPVVPPVDPNP